MKIELGREVKITPVTFGAPSGKGVCLLDGVKMRGTVVYIHPEGRFYTVDFGHGCRESFIIEDIMERLAICQRSRAAGYRRAL